MKIKKQPYQLFILFIVIIFTHCKTTGKSIQSEPNKVMSQRIGESIGHNEVLVTGRLIFENEKEVFLVETIHQRGNTAPVIGQGQKISIIKSTNAKPEYNKIVKGLLIYQLSRNTSTNQWYFKQVQN